MLASLSLWSLSFVLSVFLSRFCSTSLVFVFVLNDNSNNKHCLTLVSAFGVFVTLVPRHYSINVCIASYFVSLWTGAREPWRQSRRGSHKISPNGAKIGLGSHKFSEVIDWNDSSVFKWKHCSNDFRATSPHIFMWHSNSCWGIFVENQRFRGHIMYIATKVWNLPIWA